ncbi:MAG: hypothetical protein KJ619_04105 [Candidatus Omnitrophica bacterium]|nr:hypothetical protein [Candidatus Omnitrophota bacterium]MBU2251649.1 hypothetical protein [Candidatus Omnitrophota bacterium]MBU2474225.1 hypothetical protein [Candidatus Omnitrophota bacterium]
MRKFLAISFLNFKEAVRDKFFLGVVFFFIFYLLFCIFLGKLSVGHADKVMRDAGLAGIELTAIILVIFSFTFSFFREKENRILEVYLTDFSPGICVSGKIFGYVLLCGLYLLLSAIAFGGLLYLNQAFNLASLVALYPLFLKIVIIIFLASLFSTLFSSATTALLSLLFVYVGAELIPSALAIVKAYGAPVQKVFIKFIYLFFPNMDKLDIKSLAVYGKLPDYRFFLGITIYALVYCLFLWLINLLIFQKKEY